ncbi:MAG: hypothetical protein GWP06_03895 [Actinobacteria bacterium]|nr:hypothetical protein [Actinomycetota bacterium]
MHRKIDKVMPKIKFMSGLLSALLLLLIPAFVIGQQAGKSLRQMDVNSIGINQIIVHAVSHDAISFTCLAGADNRQASVQISFPFLDAVRVRIHPGNKSFADVRGKSFETKQDEIFYYLKTDSVSVIIRKQPWQLTILRSNGDTVFSQIPAHSGWMQSAGESGNLRITAAMQEKEGFFGFGEKFNGLNQRGKKVVMEIFDAYVAKDARTYKAIPFFISSARYGLLVNSALPIVYHLGDESETFYSFEIPDSEIDFTVFANADPLTVIRQYTDITGKPRLVPKWALEPWLSRRSMTGWNNTATAEADVDMILHNGFRLGVILWEGIRGQFDKEQNPDMHWLSDKWHALGIKQVFWSRAGHINSTSDVLKNAVQEYFIRNNDGTLCIGGFKGGYAYIDPTNPRAMAWWEKTFYQPYVSDKNGHSAPGHANLDGVKIDFCELFPKYRPPLLMHRQVKGIENLHAVLFSERIYDWLQQRKADGGITWVRGGGLGIQRVGFVWGGDRRRTFSQFRGTVSASLSLAVSGVALAGHDLGGYIGGNSPDAREVYIRGAQYAAFSPSFHDHGSAPAPWEQDAYGRENYKFYSHLRYNLLPYLYHYVRLAHETGLPLMRPLFLHYPDDDRTWSIDDEYLLGDDLLVAPFVRSGTTREIYFPKGEWVDFWSGMPYSGGQNYSYIAPLNRIPVFARNASIVPLALNDAMQPGGLFLQARKDSLLLSFCIFGRGNAHRSFYNDKKKINVSLQAGHDQMQITIKKSRRNFGLCLMANRPDAITVNRKKLSLRDAAGFETHKSGWTFDAHNLKVLIKIAGDKADSTFIIRINGLNEKKYIRLRRARFEQPGLPPAPPKILAVENRDESVDAHFQPAEGAFSYVVKYGSRPDALDKKLENVAESPVTLHNLPNGRDVYVTILALNEWGTSAETPPVAAKPGAGRKPVFSLETGTAFISGNHYVSKSFDDDGTRRLVFLVNAPRNETCRFWIKAKKNISHHLYFRWYNYGKVVLKQGVNSIELVLPKKRTEIGKLFLTCKKKDRPLLKLEAEGKYSQASDLVSPVNKIVVTLIKSRD